VIGTLAGIIYIRIYGENDDISACVLTMICVFAVKRQAQYIALHFTILNVEN